MSNADITVTGNLTVDPEVKISANGHARLSFSVASNKRFQTNGEWQEETSFFNVVAWRGIAEQAASVLEKGLPVIVKGRLEQRTWEDKESGQKRSTVEIVADAIAVNTFGIESLVRRRGGGGGGTSNQPTSQQKATVPDRDPFEDF